MAAAEVCSSRSIYYLMFRGVPNEGEAISFSIDDDKDKEEMGNLSTDAGQHRRTIIDDGERDGG